MGFGFWMNKTSLQNNSDPENDIESLVVRLIQREDKAGAIADAHFILESLEKILNNFGNVAKKIRFVSR